MSIISKYEILDPGIFTEMLSSLTTSDLEDWEETLSELSDKLKIQFTNEFIHFINDRLIAIGERPPIEPFNGFCENCDIPFIRCTFTNCPDCGMTIIPDPKEEEG